ncbi:MAG: hypothetical protein HFJ17_02415 [Clostridia bacterium]|nr:hypothetical protein [Clostridia bacterium]
MINKLKNNKGITLIALVITIIVLLILAGVAISMLAGDNGILRQAAKAKEDTGTASQEEQNILTEMEDIIEEKVNGPRKWAYKEDKNGRKTIISNGKIDLPIGTYINYNAAAKDADEKEIEEKTVTSEAGSPTDTGTSNYYKASEKTLKEGNGHSNQTFSNKATTNGWRVFGLNEKGEILIISADPVKTKANTNFYLNGIAGYTYGESELNKVCSVYGTGYGATGARSINVDDINKITGYNPNNIGVYDPEQTGIGTKYTNSDGVTYGSNITYSWTNIQNQITSSSYENGYESKFETYGFNWYDKENKIWKNSMQDTSNPKKIVTLTHNNYWYYPDSLTNLSNTTETQAGLSTTSDEYYTLFTNKAGIKVSYWLASTNCRTEFIGPYFSMYYVYNKGYVQSNYLYDVMHASSSNYSTRPVVSLKSDIKLKYDKEKQYYDIVE